MHYFSPLIVGFIVAFVGLLAPSMLNMTAARISIEKGKKESFLFSVGASIVVFIQGFLAVYFAKYLVANPEVLLQLKKCAIFILIVLSIFFFIQARKKFKASGKQKKGNSFVIGFGMSSLNMLAIPYYFAMATFAESKGWMSIKIPFSLFYVLGAVLGSFMLFIIYAYFAKLIAEKAQFMAKNINYILSILFIVLAFLTAYQVYIK